MFGIGKKDQKKTAPASVEERRPGNEEELWAAFLAELSREEGVTSPIRNPLRSFLLRYSEVGYGGLSDMLEQHLPELEHYYENRAEFIRESALLYPYLLESSREGSLSNEEALYRSMCWRMNELYETTDYANDPHFGEAVNEVQRTRMHLFTDGFSTAYGIEGNQIRNLAKACELFETFYWAYVKQPLFSFVISARKNKHDEGTFDYAVKLKKNLGEDMDRPEDPESWVLFSCYQFLVQSFTLLPEFFYRLKKGVNEVLLDNAERVKAAMTAQGVVSRFPDREIGSIAQKGVQRAMGMLLPNILRYLVKKEIHAQEEIDEYRLLKGRDALVQGLRFLDEYADSERAVYRKTYSVMRNSSRISNDVIPPEARE